MTHSWKRVRFIIQIKDFLNCHIESNIYGILIEICKQCNNVVHKTLFNGWRKIYGMNNMVMVDPQYMTFIT
jgi:hypothetical protein